MEMHKDHNDECSAFTSIFRYLLDKHAPKLLGTWKGKNYMQ